MDLDESSPLTYISFEKRYRDAGLYAYTAGCSCCEREKEVTKELLISSIEEYEKMVLFLKKRLSEWT